MTTAVVAEKPSVARDIAAALGATRPGAGCFEGGGYVVTWAIGHLVALAEPGEIDPAWKRWSLATLPMLPTRFPLVVVPGTRDQFAVIRRILGGKAVTRIICATDAGREGELIFRYIYEATGCTKPVSRLWISSLTRDAILHGLAHLRSSADYDGLADAARGRSRADWLVGMNLSRAYSLALDQDISVGRVQTPTLALLVERELEIREFVPEDYREVVATFKPRTDGESVAYVGTWFRPPTSGAPRDPDDATKRRRLPPDGVEADAIVARARTGDAEISIIKAETKSIPPPLLYDLTELQRHANRLYGLSAQKTLDVAQALYERHKLISYPRTDSRHLSQAVAATLPAVAAAVAPRYPGLLALATGKAPLGRRFVDDARVTDHHAILPTATPARPTLTADEQKIYDLICRRLLAAWHDDHIYASTTVSTTITAKDTPAIVDHYESRGTAVEQHGWKVLDIGYGKTPAKPRQKPGAGEAEQPDQALPPGLVRGQPQQVLGAKSVAKQTRPPPRHNEATLLTAMETAGKLVDDKELSDAMRDQGLGTPATRAQIIETLLRREYVVRDGKTLSATDKGIHLISVVHPEVKSPAMTGEWEAKLKRMARGDGDLPAFMSGIESFITDVVGRVTANSRTPRPAANTRPTQPRPEPPAPRARRAASELSPEPPPAHARKPTSELSPEPPPARARQPVTEHFAEPPPWLDELWPDPTTEPPPWPDEPWSEPPSEPWRTAPHAPGKTVTHSTEPPLPTARPRNSSAVPDLSSIEHSPEPPPRASRARKPTTAPSPDPISSLPEPPAPSSRARKPTIAPSLDPLSDPPALASRTRKPTAHSPDPLSELTEHSSAPVARPPRARKPTTAHPLDPLSEPAAHSPEPVARPPRARKTAHSPEPEPTEHSLEPTTRPSRARKPTAPPPEPQPPPTRTPTAADDLRGLLRARFGFPEFRPYQEAVCRAATLGRDVLLVMPTGAGKSLCYQLPGIARAGTTLIISPLIALMEDQAAKLTAQGFRAERIHSGRSRGDSRQACIDYLEGNLDYLFIAPERLRVPGFPEMLARHKPTLIAIDEAHCISQWGHDFRPDYRTLGQRLPALRPAPIVALTATATPTVQDDIAAQLGLQRPGRFIHGFRRTNIAIEVVERSPGERTAAIRELLADPARRPAIVYAATRKSTEELADALGPRLAAAYHAGMSNSSRDEVQSAFLSGRRDVIVATTAFGMGIDKPNVRTILHAALPGSLEGYYQEIGRAGRDGAPATAVLLHARVDLKTHEFFHARDYPDPRDLAAIFNKLPGDPTPRTSLNKRRGRDARDKFENALEKLIVHGGALESGDEQIIKGANSWSAGYNAQRAHKLTQLQDMAGFAAARDCRMVHLIRHFGDAADGGAPCGICDVCAPTRTIADDYKKPSPHEKTHQARILAALADSDGLATGRLHRDNFGDDLDRKSFEHVLGGLVAMGLVSIEKTSFTKRRKLIPFERASLTPAGHAHELTAAGLRLPAPEPAKKPTRKATARRTGKPRKPAAKRTTAKRKPAAKRTRRAP